MKRIVFVFTVLAFAPPVSAQAPSIQPPITAVRLVISGGVSPVTNDLPVSGLTSVPCAPIAGVVVNPTAVQYKVNATDTTCWQYKDPGNGPLLSLPIGATVYTATTAYVNSNGAGPTSPVSNSFSRPGATPTTAPAVTNVVP